MIRDILRLYLVADPDHVRGDLVSVVASAIAGGVTCVQLRAKSLTDRETLHLANALKAVCETGGVPLIVNDRIDIALAAGADGVHLGVEDLPVDAARTLAPERFIIGYSPETDSQIRESRSKGVDYLGVGPVYGTRTKDDAGDALGLEAFGRRCALSPVPVVGIGGITRDNADGVVAAGAAGIAVVSAILGAADPESAARDLRRQSGT